MSLRIPVSIFSLCKNNHFVVKIIFCIIFISLSLSSLPLQSLLLSLSLSYHNYHRYHMCSSLWQTGLPSLDMAVQNRYLAPSAQESSRRRFMRILCFVVAFMCIVSASYVYTFAAYLNALKATFQYTQTQGKFPIWHSACWLLLEYYPVTVHSRYHAVTPTPHPHPHLATWKQ